MKYKKKSLEEEEEFNISICKDAIEEYKKELNWSEKGWTPVDKTKVLRNYPEYIPTDEAIYKIKEYEPLIEIRTGNGYWSNKLKNNNTDIIATDIYPPKETYCKVKREKHTNILKQPKRNILLCHPPIEEWTNEVLELMEEGNIIIFVGEFQPGCNASFEFFETLYTNFNLIDTKPVLDWASHNAKMYILKKTSLSTRKYSYGSQKICKSMRRKFEEKYLQNPNYYLPENKLYQSP